MKRLFLDLTQDIENKMVCGSVWDLKSQAELTVKTAWPYNVNVDQEMKHFACGDQSVLLVVT